MIHVAYRLWGGDGFFAKMLGTSMLSMFENTKEEVTVHVMHNDRLTPDNRGKLCYIAGQYNQHVEFHNVEEIAGATLRKIEEAHPLDSEINAAWYPLIAHEVFPDLDKIIFFGADIIINLDINELWEYDLNELEFPLGAVSEYFTKGERVVNPICRDGYVKHEDYFNADVFLMKPSFFREKFDEILSACKFIYNHRDRGYVYSEQDALNYLFSKQYLHLPARFNVTLSQMRAFKHGPFHLEKAIYHFNLNKPSLNTNDIFDKLYLSYFMKTPWATVDIFGNLHKAAYKEFSTLRNESRDLLLHLTNLLTERKRAFYIETEYIDFAKKIFKIKDDEQLIVMQEDTDEFVQAIISTKGEKIFFVLANPYYYFQVQNFLLSQNFVEGVDFIDATIFLSERYGVPYNFNHRSRALVQNL